MALGCKIVTLPKFEAKYFFKLLDQHQVLLVHAYKSTDFFSKRYKYSFVILTKLTKLFMVTFSAFNQSLLCSPWIDSSVCVVGNMFFRCHIKPWPANLSSSLMNLVTKKFLSWNTLRHVCSSLRRPYQAYSNDWGIVCTLWCHVQTEGELERVQWLWKVQRFHSTYF